MAHVNVPLANSNLVAIVDSCDSYVLGFNWHLNGRYAATKYGYGRAGRRTEFLHRMVMKFPEYDLDHRNRNGLDCRRINLRRCNDSQNQANSQGRRDGMSCYKGVSPHQGKWRAQITLAGKRKHLGRFNTSEEAARAYDVATLQFHGEFAYLNFPI